MKSAQQLLDEVKARIREISVGVALQLHAKDNGTVFLDVRDQHEVNLGRIPGALHISRGTMETKVEALIPREASVVVYCASGNRSAFAAETLTMMGYRDVVSLAGGFNEWATSGGEVE